jgi:hypothetical protein
MHGAELLCDLSVRRMQIKHLQALSRPADLAAATAAVADLYAPQTTSASTCGAQESSACALRFCAAAAAEICKQLASVHVRLCHSEGKVCKGSLSSTSALMSSCGESDIAKAVTSGNSLADVGPSIGSASLEGSSCASYDATKRIDEAQELAELCVHAASVVASLLACGLKPTRTFGLAVRPIIEALLQRDGYLQSCSGGPPLLLQGVQRLGWNEGSQMRSVTHEAVKQLQTMDCA